ncbi:MAG: hypothetical protein JWM25_1663 [Thermoleophilia bacterium]|nr:hypothetical protein [Thermoleophilia bacterium]
MLLSFRRARLLAVPTVAALALLMPSLANAEEAPTLVSAPSVTGDVIAGGTVSCDGVVFAGENLVDATFGWYIAGGGQVGSGQVYVPTREQIGYEISCRASVSNGAGTLDAFSGQYAVEDGTPSSDSSPKIVGKATPGLAVTCTPGTWTGEGNTLSYQWTLNETPIAGATSARLLLVDAYSDKEVVCRVTATNASGSASTNSNTVSPFHPPILAPLAKKQPALPKLKAAIAGGITSKLVCNASCTTQSHAFMLATDAKRLGIRGRNLGGLIIIGTGTAKRTYKGELLVTTRFTASAKKGLAKIKTPTRIDLLFETAWGPKYSHKMYHVATSTSVKLRR